MRLLNVHNLNFEIFYEPNIPPYIIASHRWTNDEARLKDIVKRQNEDSLGYQKVEGFCRVIKWIYPGIDWFWIDTACIDQKSSAEVHEAINSMFKWYQQAYVCLAYLSDVSSLHIDGSGPGSFESSVWFTRGWTLQELVAPDRVTFLTSSWNILGYKDIPQITTVIERVTGIPRHVIRDSHRLIEIPVEERVQWLQRRETTRKEDLAYCMLGICNVYMSLIYGEGDNAWDRLEELVSKRHGRDVKLSRPQALNGGKSEHVAPKPVKQEYSLLKLTELEASRQKYAEAMITAPPAPAPARRLPRYKTGDVVTVQELGVNELCLIDYTDLSGSQIKYTLKKMKDYQFFRGGAWIPEDKIFPFLS